MVHAGVILMVEDEQPVQEVAAGESDIAERGLRLSAIGKGVGT